MILISKKKYIVAYIAVALCALSGCSEAPEQARTVKLSYVIEELNDVQGFGAFYLSLESALFEKKWELIYNMIPEKDRKYFKGEADFVDYMNKNNRLWELSVLNELSSEVEYEGGDEVREIKIYFQAQVLPGPTLHNSSLEFFRVNEQWSVSGLERLRLSPVQFEY